MLDHDVFDGFNCSHFPLGLVEPGGQTHRLIQREGGVRVARAPFQVFPGKKRWISDPTISLCLTIRRGVPGWPRLQVKQDMTMKWYILGFPDLSETSKDYRDVFHFFLSYHFLLPFPHMSP